MFSSASARVLVGCRVGFPGCARFDSRLLAVGAGSPPKTTHTREHKHVRPQHILAAQTRRDEINLELHRVEAQIKENHRAWVCEQVRTDLEVRVTLDAQLAQLKADKVAADIALAAAKTHMPTASAPTISPPWSSSCTTWTSGYLVDQAKVQAIGAQA